MTLLLVSPAKIHRRKSCIFKTTYQ